MTDGPGYADAMADMPMDEPMEEEASEAQSIESVIADLRNCLAKLEGMAGSERAEMGGGPPPPSGGMSGGY